MSRPANLMVANTASTQIAICASIGQGISVICIVGYIVLQGRYNINCDHYRVYKTGLLFNMFAVGAAKYQAEDLQYALEQHAKDFKLNVVFKFFSVANDVK